MTRQIKFRAWDGQEMLDNWMVFLEEGNTIVPRTLSRKAEIVMQFTGLLDKNGKEIYEGDIVGKKWVQESEDKYGKHFTERISPIFLVKYQDCGFTPFAYACFGDEGIDSEKVEVIGNIYQNPELLK